MKYAISSEGKANVTREKPRFKIGRHYYSFQIVSPNGIEDDCFIQSIDADTYSVRFMARENGIHQIHLKFNGVHISGSPYRIKVGKVDADPAALHAYGNGLKEIKTGQKTDFIIDTCNAGCGALGVTVDGPSKVAMDCTEVEEGYKVRYTPLVPGDYYISIKYNGYHIVGSPFKVPCTGTRPRDPIAILSKLRSFFFFYIYFCTSSMLYRYKILTNTKVKCINK